MSFVMSSSDLLLPVCPQSIVSKYGSQFRGNSQHDALEFLLWLLDRVHEDANPTINNNHSSSKTKANGKVGADQTLSQRLDVFICHETQRHSGIIDIVLC